MCAVWQHSSRSPYQGWSGTTGPVDRHVLAAAIKAGADTIVTANLSDFPSCALRPWNIIAQSPDDFVLDLIDSADRVVFACLQQIVDQRVSPPETIDEVLCQLERGGLRRAAAALRFGWPGTLSPDQHLSR